MALPAKGLLLDLAECMNDCAKAAKTPEEYEGHSEEAAVLKAMAAKVDPMSEDEALTFILNVEPLQRREALFRLGLQTRVLIFSAEKDD